MEPDISQDFRNKTDFGSRPKPPVSAEQTDQPNKTPAPNLDNSIPAPDLTPNLNKIASQPSSASQNTWRKKIILVGIIIVLVLIVMGLTASLLFAKPKIILHNLSNSSQVIFDGKNTTNNIITATAGTHYLKVSQPGYVPLDKQIKLRYFQRYKQNAQLRSVPQVRQIINQKVFSLSQDSQNTVYYLDESSRIIYQIKPSQDGQIIKTAITPALDFDLDKVIFSPDFSLAVFKLKNGETGLYDFKRYDLLNQEYHKWGNNIGEVLWRQDGKKVLYYQTLESGRKMLTLADKDNNNQQNLIFLEEYGINASPQLDWTNDQKTVLLLSDGNLYLFDIESKTAPSLVAGKKVTQAKFTPDNQKIVFTSQNQLKMVPFTSSSSQGKTLEELGKFTIEPIVELGVEALASKTIITADSSRAIAFIENKGLVEINLNSQKTKEFNYQNKDSININSLQISQDEKTLFFLTQDKKLMSLSLDKGEY